MKLLFIKKYIAIVKMLKLFYVIKKNIKKSSAQCMLF